VVRRAVPALALLVLLAGGGCPALHPGYRDDRCTAAADCFQGEVCVELRCLPAGPPDSCACAPDLGSPPDQSPPVDQAAPPDQSPPPDTAAQQGDAAMQQMADP